MTLNDIAQMFNRSVWQILDLKKLLLVFVTLIISGLICLFFQAAAFYAADFLALPLQFVPLFFAFGFLMAGAMVVSCMYAKQRAGKSADIFEVVKSRFDLILKASYLALPLLLAFVVIWLLLGIFMLLKAIPYLGTLLGVVLAFAPFLFNLGTLVLVLATPIALFFVIPSLQVREKMEWVEMYHRIKADLFSNLLLLGIAVLPVWLLWKFITSAAVMTFALYMFKEGSAERVLQSVFMMVPFLAILTPVVLFFIHFAYESFLFLDQRLVGE